MSTNTRSIGTLLTLTLFFFAGSLADRAAASVSAFTSFEVQGQAAVVDPGAQRRHVSIELTAEFMVNPGGDGLAPATEDLSLSLVDSHDFSIFVPAGCLVPNRGAYHVPDPGGCGVTVMLSNEEAVDLTPDLQFFELHLVPDAARGCWDLGVELGLHESAEWLEHSIVAILGGAEETQLVIGNDHGHATPMEIEFHHAAPTPN